MIWSSHLMFGLGIVSFFTLDPVILALAAVLSVLPDLDKPFGHRHWFSHSIFAAALFSAVGWAASSFDPTYAAVVFLAFFSHTLADSLTKSGVPILYPWKKSHYGLRLFSAHNKLANKAFVLLGLLTFILNVWRTYPA